MSAAITDTTASPDLATLRASGRTSHEEKVTVYCSTAELLSIEWARLALRADHGLSVDRGRLIREAVALVLADLSERGESSALVQRLTGNLPAQRPGGAL
jgi:hypothetical protein